MNKKKQLKNKPSDLSTNRLKLTLISVITACTIIHPLVNCISTHTRRVLTK